MTYKKCLEHLITVKSRKWIESLLAESSIQHRFVSCDDAVIERDDDGSFVWSCRVHVHTGEYGHEVVNVGGTVDDLIGICKSVVWDVNNMIVWASSKGTREALGIDHFCLRSEQKCQTSF